MGSEDTFESREIHESNFMNSNMYYKQASEHVKVEEDVRKGNLENLQ